MDDGRQDSIDSAIESLKEALRGFIGQALTERIGELKREGTLEAPGAGEETRPEGERASVGAEVREILLDTFSDPETPGARMIGDLVDKAVSRAMTDASGLDARLDEKLRSTLETVRVPTEDTILGIVRREVRNQAGTGAIPNDEIISEIARREAENAVVRTMPAAAGAIDPGQIAAALSDENVRKALIEALRPELEGLSRAAPEGAAGSADASGEGAQALRDEIAKVREELARATQEAAEQTQAMKDQIAGFIQEKISEAVGAATPNIDVEAMADRIGREARNAVAEFAGPDQIRESAGAAVTEILAVEAKDLMVRIKSDMQAAIEQKLAEFAGSEELSQAITRGIEASKQSLGFPEAGFAQGVAEGVRQSWSSDDFRSAVEEIAKAAQPPLNAIPEGMVEPITAIAVKTTEKILAKEAQDLVRQIKIELGKLKLEMKKGPDKAQIQEIADKAAQAEAGKVKAEVQTLLASKDFKTLVAAVAGDALEPRLAEISNKSAASADLKDAVAEVATGVAEKVSQESLKGFLTEIRDRVESGIESRIDEFMKSKDLRETAGKIAGDAVMGVLFSEEAKETIRALAREGAAGGGGGGGGANAEEIKEIVAQEIKRRTEEAFSDMIPRHVGKFLDDKLPPPEYFSSLVTSSQLVAEIDKRMSGSGVRAGGGGWGGSSSDTASFTNMVQKILNSDQLKEAFDDRFKVISNFIKNELVPKEVKKVLKDKA